MSEVMLALPPPPPVRRPRIHATGAALGAAAVVVFMATLVGFYAAARFAVGNTTADWVPDGVNVQLSPGGVIASTLVLSVPLMHWAIQAVGAGARRNAYLAAALTLAMAAAYFNATSFAFGVMGISLADHGTYALATYGVLVGHMLVMAVATGYVAVMTLRTLGGNFTRRDREGLVAAAFVWDTAVATYLPVWYFVFVLK